MRSSAASDVYKRQAIRAALSKVDPASHRLRFVQYADADHGFMCEARSAFNPQASAQGWRLLLGDEPEG
jgi:carboxymethylenebutenolidase